MTKFCADPPASAHPFYMPLLKDYALGNNAPLNKVGVFDKIASKWIEHLRDLCNQALSALDKEKQGMWDGTRKNELTKV